jgi:uncharacterized membrane protein YgdD (TMEM256/DUF423 family)
LESSVSWISISAVIGFLGVAFGAFGAHGLKGRVPENLLAAYHTGVLYHLIHAVALLALALYGRATSTAIGVPATLLAAGIVLFSGSLYAMALTGMTRLGIITPFGGLCFLAGWVMIAIRLR